MQNAQVCFCPCFLKNKFIMVKLPVKINLTPPLAVAKKAERGLELRKKFGKGGTEVGVARAVELKNRRNLSPSTIFRMVSYFARHEVDKMGKDFFNKKKPSKGYIAWLLWGGDPGWRWALKKKAQIKKASLLTEGIKSD